MRFLLVICAVTLIIKIDCAPPLGYQQVYPQDSEKSVPYVTYEVRNVEYGSPLDDLVKKIIEKQILNQNQELVDGSRNHNRKPVPFEDIRQRDNRPQTGNNRDDFDPNKGVIPMNANEKRGQSHQYDATQDRTRPDDDQRNSPPYNRGEAGYFDQNGANYNQRKPGSTKERTDYQQSPDERPQTGKKIDLVRSEETIGTGFIDNTKMHVNGASTTQGRPENQPLNYDNYNQRKSNEKPHNNYELRRPEKIPNSTQRRPGGVQFVGAIESQQRPGGNQQYNKDQTGFERRPEQRPQLDFPHSQNHPEQRPQHSISQRRPEVNLNSEHKNQHDSEINRQVRPQQTHVNILTTSNDRRHDTNYHGVEAKTNKYNPQDNYYTPRAEYDERRQATNIYEATSKGYDKGQVWGDSEDLTTAVVDLDDRANFSAAKCPPGERKINGRCVPVE